MDKISSIKHRLYIIIYILVSVIVLIWAYFWIMKALEIKAEKEVENINIVLDNWTENFDNCTVILDFDKTIALENDFFNESRFDWMNTRCDNKFNVANIDLSKDNCEDIIKLNENTFVDKYIILDNFEEKRKECTSKFLTTKFSTWALFDVENDFKTEIKLEFSLDFYTDIWDEDSDEFLINRIDAKKRLKDLITITPELEFDIGDIVLYSKKWILKLPLKPLTEYKISLKDFDTTIWEKTENKDFIFTTPENRYFWMKVLDKVSLYQDNNPPRFQIIEYNSSKTKSKVKICRIPNETYAKIEVFRKKAERTDVKEFFEKEISKLENFECSEKEIVYNESTTPLEPNLIKKDFNFDDLIWEKSRSWLYFVQFVDSSDREFNWRYNYPIFFWIVDSHVTMKISRNWEAFFFVNDFEWKPLAKQNIKLYFNDFKEIKKEYNQNQWGYDIVELSVLDKNIFSEAIYLWLTWDDWILKVNLKELVDDPYIKEDLRWAFSRTFSSDWEFNWEWLYNTFFITSASDTNLSYVNSTWNAWIAPWNFWYKTSNYYWWAQKNSDQDLIKLDRWARTELDYYSHIYTDRLLYLPWETVNVKSIIRDSKDLSIPKDKIVKLQINDSKWKNLLEEELKLNEYWSISSSIDLAETAALWNYNMILWVDEKSIAFWGFSVEVFKNPKFKNDISLETIWLNDWLVKIETTDIEDNNYWSRNIYSGDFKIKWNVFSKYYNWASVANANYKYKVYKQYYYENSYWDDCYYGCYWEPRKEFYSEWKGTLDENWAWNFEIDIAFSSSYNNYKYIVEVTVTDKIWDTISWTNSVVAKLPAEYKRYNRDLSVVFNPKDKFVKAWDKLTVNWWLNVWNWTSDYNDKYVLVIKKKEYKNKAVDDVRWYERNITRVEEKLEKILFVNNTNFSLWTDWKLKLDYKLDDVWEYILEYWKIDNEKNIDLNKIINDFNTNKILEKEVETVKDIEVCEKIIHNSDNIENNDEAPKRKVIKEFRDNIDYVENTDCKTIQKTIKENIKLSDLYTDKQYFSVLTYWDTSWNIPLVNDNKIRVIPEKISYNLWEKAKVLIRLPFSKWKILWTIEKQWVLETEYIDVNSNTFFKEILIDDKFIPNAYIWVVAIEINWDKVPEYKVWYSEIVVDKTDKKSFITINSDKETYKPREKVTLNINVKDKNSKANPWELTVMVVDDSLISLLWNVDLNSLEKFYKKLPFSIQTSITNIAMLDNYYFSRPGIVGWSWFWSFKWWDSAVSSRNIFKNTAYYNPSVITDKNWNAEVSFDLPDNLTNFRVMVVSNSKDNLFGYSESFIEVRKNVIVEDKTPLILRDWDVSVIWANIFNNTQKEIWFKVELETKVAVAENVRNIIIEAWSSKDIYWAIKANKNNKEIAYKITALWDSAENSDKIENIIKFKESPVLINNIIKSWKVNALETLDLNIDFPENIDLEKTEVELSFSNNKLSWIEKIVSSLARYPYGCIEQTVSSTLPNAILKKFDNLFSWIVEDSTKIDTNIEAWVNRIKSMQTEDWWFAYWQGSNESNSNITPYVVRSLLEMKELWVNLPDWLLENAIKYLQSFNSNNNNSINKWDSDILWKSEIFWALAYAWDWQKAKDTFFSPTEMNSYTERHGLIAYTYGLILTDKEKYKLEIEKNIEKIKSTLSDKDYNYYWNNLSDKAIFTKLLIDFDYSRDYIDQLIWDLYTYDWNSYYYSTQAKNNAFMSFSKYIEKYSKENSSKFSYSIWTFSSKGWTKVWDDKDNLYKTTIKLSDLISENSTKLNLKTTNLFWDKLYINYILKTYPKDKTKIKSYSNWINITRKIYEVLDENNLVKCSSNYYNWNKSTLDCSKVLKLVEDNVYKKWSLYKVDLRIDFDDNRNRRNLTIEDYLPWTFRVINSKFKTEQISVNQGTTRSWRWNHVEYNPDVVMANASYIWKWGSNFEYFVRAEFEWFYVQPPATTYMMYNPEIRANTEFRVIEVK